MTNEEKILDILEKQGKTLENLQAGQKRLEEGQQKTHTILAQHKTMFKVLEAGQNDIRENMATQADVLDMKAEQTKLKRRIENVEEHTKTPNPHKN